MKRLVMVCLAAAWLASVGSTLRADDAQIAQEIVSRLRQQQESSQLRGFNIGIQVDQATVTMMGQVASQQQATLALEVARRVPGVKLVVNDLQVRPPVAAQAAVQPVTGAMHASATQPQAPTPPQLAHLQNAAAPGSYHASQATPAYAAENYPSAAAYAREQSILVPGPTAAAPTMPAHLQSTAGSRRAPAPYAPAYTLIARQAAAQDVEQSIVSPGSGPVYMGGDPAVVGSGPVPMYPQPLGTEPVAPAYDNPVLPQYAWPTYAAYPNYAAVTYPRQYSATAWPYIGPFYPYPQVPLGWRKVTLEWDDGWWFLDFDAKSHQ
jgi:hypothetical protein